MQSTVLRHSIHGMMVIIYIRVLKVYYYISGTFDGDFNLAVWQFFLNCQTKVTAKTILRGHFGSIL